MGDRVSVQFVNKNDSSVVLFSHWGGMSFVEKAKKYAQDLKREVIGKEFWPLDRLEPQTVMVDFIRHMTQGLEKVENDLYLGRTETDGDNGDNGHFEIPLDDRNETYRRFSEY